MSYKVFERLMAAINDPSINSKALSYPSDQQDKAPHAAPPEEDEGEMIKCPDCGGAKEDVTGIFCPRCRGSGEVWELYEE